MLHCSRVLSHQTPLSGLEELFWRKMVASIQESSGNNNYIPFTVSSHIAGLVLAVTTPLFYLSSVRSIKSMGQSR